MQTIQIKKNIATSQYAPIDPEDLPLFQHLCAGSISVTDPQAWLSVFWAHDCQFEIV